MKKTILLLGICLTGSALCATNTSTSDKSGNSLTKEISRYRVGLASTMLQAPNGVKGTERLHGMGIEIQREIKLQNGLSTNTIANVAIFSEDKNNTETLSDGSFYKDNYKSSSHQITIAQSVTKNISTQLGIFSFGGSLGLTEFSTKMKYKSRYTDNIDTSYNYFESGTSEYKAFGQTIGLSASLKLNNGVMPFVSYRTTSFNDATIYWTSKSSTKSYKDSSKIKDLDIQAISIGLGYAF